MLVRALVNDIKCHDSGRRFPPRADVDIDLHRSPSRHDLYVIPVLVLIIRRLVWENGVNGHTFTQAFSYPFHLQSTGSCFGSDLEVGLRGFDEGRRNSSLVWYGEGVGTR